MPKITITKDIMTNKKREGKRKKNSMSASKRAKKPVANKVAGGKWRSGVKALSNIKLIVFITVFAGIGSYMLFKGQAATLRFTDFETGDFSQIQSGNPTLVPVNSYPSGSSVVISSDRAYDGSKSAKASVLAGDGNKYARTIWDLTNAPWTEGSDIWYGQAIYFPVGFKNAMQSYFVPMRWDDYGSNSYTTYGGISMWSDKRFRLFRVQYGVSQTEESLSSSFDIPEGSWQRLEVHQKFSKTDGQALSEVYLNDVLVVSSTKANFYGDPITRLRNGIVALGTQTNALDVWIDRLYIGTTKLGQPPAADTQPPSAPAGLTTPSQTTTGINLSWTASTDNIGVTGYDVYRNNVKVGTIATTSYSDTGLTASTAYSYYVIAKDAAGNPSLASNTISATTQASTSTPADTIAPVVTISKPINGSTVGRSTAISATASGNVAVTKMEVYADGAIKATSATGSISYTWSTKRIAAGAHTITVKAYDGAGNAGQSSVTVYK